MIPLAEAVVHMPGHSCPGWPHCYTPIPRLQACVDEVEPMLASGELEDPNGGLAATCADIRAEIARRGG